jgi:hypothetical protein
LCFGAVAGILLLMALMTQLTDELFGAPHALFSGTSFLLFFVEVWHHRPLGQIAGDAGSLAHG